MGWCLAHTEGHAKYDDIYISAPWTLNYMARWLDRMSRQEWIAQINDGRRDGEPKISRRTNVHNTKLPAMCHLKLSFRLAKKYFPINLGLV